MELNPVQQDTTFPVITYGDIIKRQKSHRPYSIALLSMDMITFPAYSCWTITSSKEHQTHYTMDLLRVDQKKASMFEFDTKDLKLLRDHAMALVFDTTEECIKLLVIHYEDMQQIYRVVSSCMYNREYDFTTNLLMVEGSLHMVTISSTEEDETVQQDMIFTFNYADFNDAKFLNRHVKYVKYNKYKELVQASQWDNKYYPLRDWLAEDHIIQQRLT